MLRHVKDYQKAIEQQLDLSSNVKKANQNFLIPVNDDIFQQIIPINKSGLKFILALQRNEDEFIYSHNKLCVIYSPQEDFYPSSEDHPSTSVVGDI